MSLRGRRRGGGGKNELVFLTTCGPATTFDPKITGVDGVWYFDDGTTIAAASGAEISKTFAADGLHRAVYRPSSGGLAAITNIRCESDEVISIQNIDRTAINTLVAYSNNSISINLSSLPYLTYVSISSTGRGVLCDLSRLNPAITRCELSYSTTSAKSIAHLVALQVMHLGNLSWLTADVDTVIDSMWAARANYTYATPSLNIGGTNQAPTGNVTAPVEGADWHQDGATWIPRTAGAKIYDLAKDVNSEGFNKWTITYTGGSIAP